MRAQSKSHIVGVGAQYAECSNSELPPFQLWLDLCHCFGFTAFTLLWPHRCWSCILFPQLYFSEFLETVALVSHTPDYRKQTSLEFEEQISTNLWQAICIAQYLQSMSNLISMTLTMILKVPSTMLKNLVSCLFPFSFFVMYLFL